MEQQPNKNNRVYPRELWNKHRSGLAMDLKNLKIHIDEDVKIKLSPNQKKQGSYIYAPYIPVFKTTTITTTKGYWSFDDGVEYSLPRRERRRNKKFEKDLGIINNYKCFIVSFVNGNYYLRVENWRSNEIITVQFSYLELNKVLAMINVPNWKKNCLLSIKDEDDTKRKIANALLFFKEIKSDFEWKM